MTFNWPDIPFSGTEVDAFVTEYKALAQAIYEDSNNIIYDVLKMPYREPENIKILLENGLLYASFIVKQRSGGTGPGTDFILDNSPYRPPFTSGQIINLLKSLGCVFTEDAMNQAWQINKEKDPSLDDPRGLFSPDGTPNLNDFVQNVMNTLLNGADGNPNNLNLNDYLQQLQQAEIGELDAWTDFLISMWEGIRAPFGVNPFRGMITTSVRQYLSDNGAQITNSNFSDDEITLVKEKVQELYENDRNIWPEGHPQRANIFGAGVPFIDVTNNFNATQQQAFNLPPGGTIVQMPAYGTDLRQLLGVFTAVVDANGNVISVHDDFDFLYGNEIDRSGTNQIPGSPYNPSQVVDGASWGNNATKEQVQNEHPGGQRAVIIEYKDRGKGTPVPITLIFP